MKVVVPGVPGRWDIGNSVALLKSQEMSWVGAQPPSIEEIFCSISS